MWMTSLGCGISPPTPTLDREGRMAWNGTTREKYRRGSDRYESDLTDGEWRVVEPLLPPPSRPGRRRTVGLRTVFGAIRYMSAKGCRWRAIPGCFPPLRRFGTTSAHGATTAFWSA